MLGACCEPCAVPQPFSALTLLPRPLCSLVPDSWGATNIYYDMLARQVGGPAVPAQKGGERSAPIGAHSRPPATPTPCCPSPLQTARQVDEYAWENPDFLPVFAAGNDGGKAKPGTLASPAGASRNGAGGMGSRPGVQQGQQGAGTRCGAAPSACPK